MDIGIHVTGEAEMPKSQTNGLLHLFFRRTGSVTKGGMCVVISKKRHALSPSSKAFLNDIYTSVVVKVNQHVALGLPFQPSFEISRIEKHDSVDFSLKVLVCMAENYHVAFFLLCLLPDRSNTRYSVEMSVCQEDPMTSLPDNELVRQLPGQVIIAVAAHNIAWQVSGCLPKLMCLHLDITCNEDRIDILFALKCFNKVFQKTVYVRTDKISAHKTLSFCHSTCFRVSRTLLI